jgi:acyl-CoA dehydrogenase
MTERTGGSDVGLSETVARRTTTASGTRSLRDEVVHVGDDLADGAHARRGPRATRPEARPRALLPRARDEPGAEGILVNRLKDKLGTRKVPTAELTLDGALAVPCVGTSDGVRASPRCSTSPARGTRSAPSRACAAGSRSPATTPRKRVQFGALLSDKPLHADTLADMQAEFEGAFHLTFRAVELLGREEAGELTEAEARLLRLLTPIAKLTTGKQAVPSRARRSSASAARATSRTRAAALLRDAQVLPIWEGTTNVLSLDVLPTRLSWPSAERSCASCMRAASWASHLS